MPNKPGDKVIYEAPSPFRHRDNETVTITLERYEALKNSREVVEVKNDVSPVLRGRVDIMNKKISDLENDIRTYNRFLGALVAQFNSEHPDENLFHIMEDVADSMGMNAISSDDGITLTEEDIYDAVARQRDNEESNTGGIPY